MLKTHVLPVIAALGLAVTGNAALAQGMGPMGNISGAFLVDANDDGIVSQDEASRNWFANFTLLDLEEDGQLSEAEYLDMAMPAPRGRVAAQQLFANRAERFGLMDTNGDKMVTQAEYMAAAQAAFQASDTDGDGKVTVWEYRAGHRP